MREEMGIILTTAAYTVYGLFLGRVGWRFALVSGMPPAEEGPLCGRVTPRMLAKAVADMLFLTRLFLVNGRLWFWEWLFHITFLFVALRHLRFFLEPVPAWLVSVQTPGICAGLALPLSLIFILLIKIRTESRNYVSTYNFFLLALIFFISATGITMKYFFRPDVVDIKNFIIGVLIFRPGPAPVSVLFTVHFALTLILLAYLPTHVVAAPWTIIEARKREEALHLVMHEK
jgi:nitrate reductase gamma subunit